MKWIFEQTKLGHWNFKLNFENDNFYFLNSIASLFDMDESDLENIIIECGGVRGYEINPQLYLDDYFYFQTFEQRSEFENRMEPYVVMRELTR